MLKNDPTNFKNFTVINSLGVFWFFLVTLFRVGGFLFVAYLTVANLARLVISVHCQVSVRSKYLLRFLYQCWITGGHTIHPPIEGLLPLTSIEPTPFRNSAFKVAGLQVHVNAPVDISLFKKIAGCLTRNLTQHYFSFYISSFRSSRSEVFYKTLLQESPF